MVTPRIIPCLDVDNGRVVKGVKFSGLRDMGSPPELAAAYERQGADELVILDVSATPEARRTAAETVRDVRAVLSIPLTVGGGIRGKNAFIAHGDTQIKPYDRVVVFALPGVIHTIGKFFN